MNIEFAGESRTYRQARIDLLAAEKSLRQQTAAVAALRQALPKGHIVSDRYRFRAVADSGTHPLRLADLFTLPNRSLVIYSFMFTGDTPPCPMCTAFLDAFDGVARHAQQQLNLAVAARADVGTLRELRSARNWYHLPLYSAAESDYSRDYYGETTDGAQLPMLNVFSMEKDVIYHRYTNELFFEAPEPGQDPRHMDQLMPLWNLFDVTPEGRPTDWFPSA